MEFGLWELLAAFGGGLFGAAIGALPAFIFTGFFILVGSIAELGGSAFDMVFEVGLGVIFGPHIAFGGAVAATAYAAWRKKVDDGKNILVGLAGLNNSGILLIGGIFGAIGYTLEKFIALGVGDFTDTIALTVIISAIIARLIFGNTGLFKLTSEARERGRFTPGGDNVWVVYQQSWIQILTLAVGAGVIAAWMALQIEPYAPESAFLVGFGLSAFSLIFFQFNVQIPITHHMTIIAGLAAVTSGSLLVGVLFAVLSGLVGEASARLFLIHGDTHIDPPANAIWIMTTVILIGEYFGLFDFM